MGSISQTTGRQANREAVKDAIEETVQAINTQGGSGDTQQKAGGQGAGEGEEPSQKAQLFMGAN